MVILAESVTVAADLEQARTQLAAISHRVEAAAAAAPRHDASGWEGPAAWAYQHSLDRLSRDLETAQELLRSAADLTAAALFEIGAHV
jgi:uncharacterized protein YukE